MYMDGVMIYLHLPPPLPLCKRPHDLLNEQFGGLSVYHGQVIFIATQPPEFFPSNSIFDKWRTVCVALP